MTQDLVFSSVRGVDDFFFVRILFTAGTSVFDGDDSFTCDLVLFGILASKSDSHTLERKEGRVSFVRWGNTEIQVSLHMPAVSRWIDSGGPLHACESMD